jgi:hypothetical protein
MEYSVECECGNRVPVTAAQAGSVARCQCGRAVEVPPLSELRQAAGKRSFESGIIDTIRRMISEGNLPSTRECALTGCLTDDIAVVRVQCERVWKRGPKKSGWFFLLFALFLPFFWISALVSWALLDEKREDLGRDTVVDVPLRVCRDQQHRLRCMRQGRIRRLLRADAIYANLLREYPRATVRVVQTEQR